MSTRPDSPDPAAAASPGFAQMGADMSKGLAFFQDWMKAAGSGLPHLSGAGGGGLSGWTLPTLDPAELDKRIQELRTVQFWLEQNARMIAMTIQGLEVQRMTLHTLQGMNVSMSQLKDALKATPDAMQGMFTAPTSPAPERPAPPEPKAESPAPTPAPAPTSSWFQGVPDEPPAGPQSDDEPAPAPAADGPSAPATDLINPMRWWDTLTQQFTHLAGQAAAHTAPLVPGQPAPSAQQAQAPARRPRKAAGSTTGAAQKSAAKRTGKGRP